MTYKEYIDFGFERIDIDCQVEFNETGYYGFELGIQISNNQFIYVNSSDLNRPRLFISKKNTDNFHIIPIRCDMIIDLIK